MQKPKILIIDDDPDIGMIMKMMLKSKGYDVSILSNPYFIEEEISNHPYNLIFMDMLLSGRNGIDICEALKRNVAMATIPLIMMSAHPDAMNICLKAGANDFVAKPFEVKKLLLKVAEILKDVKE